MTAQQNKAILTSIFNSLADGDGQPCVAAALEPPQRAG